MKTNPVAKYLVRIRVILVCVAIVALAGLEFHWGATLAARIGQTAAWSGGGPPAPNVNLSELMIPSR